MTSRLSFMLLILAVTAVLICVLRGLPGNPNEAVINNLSWTDDGPFELSVERGRFALTYTLAEYKSFFFSLPIARFSTPDLGFNNGFFVSLFSPGPSFLVLPGYLLGKIFGFSQVGAFSTISLFALANFMLLRSIAIRLGANPVAAALGAFAFTFATPALPYSTTLYQHHISTFLILASLYTLLASDSLWSLSLVWFLCAASIPVDYPNLILMFPIGVFALGRFISAKTVNSRFLLKVRFAGFLTLLAAAIPLVFFLWFNYKSYGDPLQFSGTVSSVREIDENGKPVQPKYLQVGPEDVQGFINPEQQKKSAIEFFQSRYLTNDFYIHFFSPDRGTIYYAPVILLGLFGGYILYKKASPYLPVLVGIVGADLLLYSMWGDPWGGWAFGSRYLIPAYAIMGILLAFALSHWRKNILFLLTFSVLLVYSLGVNVLGAITSNRNPPQVEILALEKLSGRQEKYTFARNLDMVKSNFSKSFVFNLIAKKYLTAWQYYLLLIGFVTSLGLFLTAYLYLHQDGHR